jgi:hypothetical protein
MSKLLVNLWGFVNDLGEVTGVPVLIGPPGHKALPFDIPYMSFVNGQVKTEGAFANPCPDFPEAGTKLWQATIEAIRRTMPNETVALVLRRGDECQFETCEAGWDMDTMTYSPKRVQFRTRVAFITNRTLKGVEL